MKVPKWLQRWCLREEATQCHRIAEKILYFGFDNPTNIQQHLDRAKDELYSAARAFKEESEAE